MQKYRAVDRKPCVLVRKDITRLMACPNPKEALRVSKRCHPRLCAEAKA